MMSSASPDSPYRRALELHVSQRGPRPFAWDVLAHFRNGYVFSTPELFLLMRPVTLAAEPQMLVNPWCRFDPDTSDAWFVYLAAGDLRQAFVHLPFWLAYTAYERRGKLRVRYTAELQKRIEVCS